MTGGSPSIAVASWRTTEPRQASGASSQVAGFRYVNVYGPRMDTHGAYTEVLIRWMDNIDAGKPPVIFGDGSRSSRKSESAGDSVSNRFQIAIANR